jgi:hypothetical protein
MAHSPSITPLAIPFFTYLAPSSCDRNRLTQSQVARKLTPFVPHWPLVPSLPNSQPFLGFPGLNVYPIRATSQTQSPVYSTGVMDAESVYCPPYIPTVATGTRATEGMEKYTLFAVCSIYAQ